MFIASTLVTAGFVTWALTGLVRRYALAHELLDRPNHRSAHTAPIPRGGGLALVCIVSTGLIFLYYLDLLSGRVFAAFLGGGLLTATVGWADDRHGLTPGLRVLVHLLAAIWAVHWLNGLPSLELGNVTLRLGFVGSVLAVLTIVWLINLYNFMDGIDGLAAVNALTVASAGAVLMYWNGASQLSSFALLLAGVSIGFLIWNWSPARIFLGDVGSGALGFYFGALAVASENAHSLPFIAWIFLLGIFVVDATITLLRRVAQGERWYAAHNNHAYQRAVRAGYSHRAVSISVAFINVALGICAFFVISLGNWLPAIGAIFFLLLLYAYVERVNPMLHSKAG